MHRIAIADMERQVWENPLGEIDLFSTHSDVYYSTWPSSGMTRNGSAYALPTPEHPTDGSGSSFLPTPRASDGPHGGPNQRGSKGDLMLSSAVHQLLPTPAAMNPNDGEGLGSWEARRLATKKRVGNGNG